MNSQAVVTFTKRHYLLLVIAVVIIVFQIQIMQVAEENSALRVEVYSRYYSEFDSRNADMEAIQKDLTALRMKVDKLYVELYLEREMTRRMMGTK